MKRAIQRDEWYPVYCLVPEIFQDMYTLVDFSQEELDFIEKANKTFEKAQDILRDKLWRVEESQQYDEADSKTV